MRQGLTRLQRQSCGTCLPTFNRFADWLCEGSPNFGEIDLKSIQFSVVSVSRTSACLAKPGVENDWDHLQSKVATAYHVIGMQMLHRVRMQSHCIDRSQLLIERKLHVLADENE